MNPHGPTESIYDLDGVLTRTDTMAALVSTRLRRHPHRLAAALPIALAAAIAPPGGRLRPALHRHIVARALTGLEEDAYRELASRTGREFAHSRAVVREAVASCRAARLKGPVLIATASEETLARSFLDALGLEDIPLAASRLQFTRGAPRLLPHNVGTAKLAAVRAAGFTPERAVFYTDSASDLPLAQIAYRTVAVNPRWRSAKKLAAAVQTLSIADWR